MSLVKLLKPRVALCLPEAGEAGVIRITSMVASDIPEIMEIERESQLEPWSEGQFLEELDHSHSHVFVARAVGRRTGYERAEGTALAGAIVETPNAGDPCLPPALVAGYICIWCIADEIQILNVAVRKDYRRLGIGSRLLAAAFDKGYETGARMATLEVRRSNSAARLLYDKAGFRRVGERPDYYGGLKEPAILMILNLEKNGVISGGLRDSAAS